MQERPLDFDLLLSIDIIKALGGVCIIRSGNVKFDERMLICATFHVESLEVVNKLYT